MKNSTGIFIAVLAAAAGAAATVFALKRKSELDDFANKHSKSYDFDDFDECTCEEACECGDECACEDDYEFTNDSSESSTDNTSPFIDDAEIGLDLVEDEVEDADKPFKSDF